MPKPHYQNLCVIVIVRFFFLRKPDEAVLCCKITNFWHMSGGLRILSGCLHTKVYEVLTAMPWTDLLAHCLGHDMQVHVNSLYCTRCLAFHKQQSRCNTDKHLDASRESAHKDADLSPSTGIVPSTSARQPHRFSNSCMRLRKS